MRCLCKRPSQHRMKTRTSITRRTLLKSAVAVPIAMSLPFAATAQTADTVFRYAVASPQGHEMLVIYADAVRAMEAMGNENPMGWLWQWYTHFVNPTTTKGDEITRIFGDTPSALRSLADEMWNTCQSHAGQDPNHFLPWHRIYVFYFERICRHVTGRPDFTLPYWDYTSTDPANRGVVPIEFRMPDDPVFGVLYRAERNALANSGEPVHMNQPFDAMNIDSIMGRQAYSTEGSVMGFCRAVDSGIHGRMHVLIGNSRGMGSVPWAGSDPIFWVHHSNVDRMWASWNRAGGKNPNPAQTPWTQTFFIYADANGVRRNRKFSDFFSCLANKYGYDTFIPVPPPPQTAALETGTATAATLAAGSLLAAATTGTPLKGDDDEERPVDNKRRAAITGSLLAAAVATEAAVAAPKEQVGARGRDAARLGSAQGASVDLLPAAGARATQVLGLDESQVPDRAGRPQSRKRTFLVLRDLHTWKQPEVLYHVYLRPGNGAGKLDRSTYVGDINFFDAEFHDHGGGDKGDVLGSNFYSFDVTEILRTMRRGNAKAAGSSLRVTIVPAGSPAAGSEPLVATFALVHAEPAPRDTSPRTGPEY